MEEKLKPWGSMLTLALMLWGTFKFFFSQIDLGSTPFKVITSLVEGSISRPTKPSPKDTRAYFVSGYPNVLFSL